MSVITCTNAFAGREEGYDPNRYNNTQEATDIHLADSHVEEYVGCVLDTFERNMSDDSDFYAIVWDEEDQSVKSVMYATTRGWTYHNKAFVDATKEAQEKATKWAVDHVTKLMISNWSVASAGKRVESLTKRGKYVGVTGVVLKTEPSEYNRYDHVAHIDVDNKPLRWPAKVSVSRLKVIEPMDEDAIRQVAWERVHRIGIRSVVRASEFGGLRL